MSRPVPLTVITPLRPGGSLVVRAVFWLGDRFPILLVKLQRLSFIHFARWAVIGRIPRNGREQPRERLRYRYLLFESDFDGDFDDYIAAFSTVLGSRLRAVWGTSFGFPGPLPAGRLQEYVRRQELPVRVYYVAFPDASTAEIRAALELTNRFAVLRPALAGATDSEFLARWRAFVTEMQRAL
jgi:hypothetical protein